jgi:integrase
MAIRGLDVPRTYLTAISIEAMKAERQIDFWDTKTPSFAVRVGPRSKTFVAKIGNRRITLGSFPSTSLQEARRKALALKAANSPVLRAPAFLDALEAFLKVKETHLRPRSYSELRRTLKRHFSFKKTLDKITHADILSTIEAIKAASEAAHAFKDIRSFFNWCVPRYISNSPCNGLKQPHKYTSRARLLSDAEIKAIWKAADQLGGYGKLVQFLVATGQRAGQIAALKTEWIKDRIIIFPASIMKGDLDHAIPFAELTASLLRSNESRPTAYQGKKKHQLDELSGVGNWVLHDLRRYYSSTHRKLKTPIDITEALLSHTSGSRSEIQRIYDLYDRMDEMREAAERYEAHILKLVT